MSTYEQLYENTPTGSWDSSVVLTPNGFNWGPAAVPDGGFAVALGWYWAGGSHHAPQELALWDSVTGVRVAHVSSPEAASGSIGWKWSGLSAPVALVNGHQYKVAGYWPAGTIPVQQAQSNRGAAPTHWAWSDYGRYYIADSTSEPNTAQSGLLVGVDVGWSDDGTPWPGEPAGGGGGGTNSDLASWLSSQTGVNAHKTDGLPWKTYQEVTDGDTGLGAIAGLLGDAIGAGWSSATDTLHQIGSKVGSILTAVTDGPLPGITGLEDLANTIIDKLDAAATFLQNPTAGWPGAASGRQVFPATGWTMVDEVDFTFQKSWDVPADLYVLTVSTFPPDIVDVNVDGAHWRPRLGWWAQRNGDGFGARAFVDWETSYLQDAGRRMNGVVIRTQPACECHIQAWVLA